MIEVIELKKSFDNIDALKGIDLSIKKGEIYGLLGPNGAGKTTAISILSTILKADSGKAIISNYDVSKNARDIKKIIGVVPQEIALYNDFSAIENLMFWGKLYKIPYKELSNRAENVLKLFGLEDRKDDPVKNYSGGMKRRINIASALLHKPKILFMDEPTVGIDPQSRNLIFEAVKKLSKEGMTIVYTTHYMEEAEKLCDRIGIIDNGKIIAEGTLDDLKNISSEKEAISITFTKIDDNTTKELTTLFQDIIRNENTIYFYTSNIKADLPKLVLECYKVGLEIISLEILRTNLESIFLNLTGKQLRD